MQGVTIVCDVGNVCDVGHDDVRVQSKPWTGAVDIGPANNKDMDGVTGWLMEGRASDFRDPNPVRSTRKISKSLSESKMLYVLTRSRCAQAPVCVRTHTNHQVRTIKIMLELGGLQTHKNTQHALYN